MLLFSASTTQARTKKSPSVLRPFDFAEFEKVFRQQFRRLKRLMTVVLRLEKFKIFFRPL